MNWSTLPSRLIRPNNCVLLVVDVQNDFCARGGVFARHKHDLTQIRAMMLRLKKLLESARPLGVRIAFTQHEHNDAQVPELIALRNGLFEGGNKPCRPGTWGAEFCSPVLPKLGEPIFTKHRYSAFSNTTFDQYLRDANVSTLIVTGVLTNVCVETTVRDADLFGYCSVVVKDCVASDSLRLHRNSLANLDAYFGWTCTASTLIRQWQV
jgi:ureidoacrylate peracid hydrolase